MDERQKRVIFDIMAEEAFRLVSSALDNARVEFAPVKGIVLSRWIYDDVSDRPYVDVDLLVRRRDFVRAAAIVSKNGWPISYRSDEMGEIAFMVGLVPVELHAEFGRVDLSRVTIDDILARTQKDRSTFAFEISRIDDVDHFLLLVMNVVKDGFVYANAHQFKDLDRLLSVLDTRWEEVVTRAQHDSLLTALHATVDWMIQKHDSATFTRFRRDLPHKKRPLFSEVLRLHRKVTVRRSRRLHSLSALLGIALAAMTPDDLHLRFRGLSRVARRGVLRRLRRDPG